MLGISHDEIPVRKQNLARASTSSQGHELLGVRDSNPPIRIQSPLSCRLDEPPNLLLCGRYFITRQQL